MQILITIYALTSLFQVKTNNRYNSVNLLYFSEYIANPILKG
jgi:hypothetical protein